MKKLKAISILGFSLGAFIAINVATPNAWCEPVSSAQLKVLFKKYLSLDSFAVDFKQKKRLQELKATIDSEGVLKVSKPKAMVVWQVTKPSPLLVELSEKGVHIVSGQGSDRTEKTFERNAKVEGEMKSLTAMTAWLKFDVDLIQKSYDIQKLANDDLQFKPHPGSGDPFSKLTAQMAPSGYISKLILDEVSGDQVLLEFKTPKVGPWK